MLHTHLENFTSAYPIIGVLSEAEPIKGTSQQFQLFETPLRDPARLAETLGRLAALLGADRVGSPVLEETHRPDAFRMEPFTWQLTHKKHKAEPEIGRTKLNLGVVAVFGRSPIGASGFDVIGKRSACSPPHR